MKDIKVFSGNSNPALARAICAKLGVPLGNSECGTFSDGENFASIYETVRGSDVYIIQSTCARGVKGEAGFQSVNDRLMEMLIMIEAMKRVKGFWKIVVILPFFLLAEVLRTDYAGNGIMIIAMLALTKGAKQEKWLRLAGFTLLLWFGAAIQIGPVSIPMEVLGLVGVPYMFCYTGKKLTHSKAVQWAFYLFYPVHLTVLVLLEVLLFG